MQLNSDYVSDAIEDQLGFTGIAPRVPSPSCFNRIYEYSLLKIFSIYSKLNKKKVIFWIKNTTN
jgi:hypothetical protein